MNTPPPSSKLQIVSDCSDSDRGFPFSEANKGFLVAAFSQEEVGFYMEVCLESFIGGLHVAAVESATLTSIVLTKYEGGELLKVPMK